MKYRAFDYANFANATPKALTMSDIIEAMKLVKALPRVVNEITVSPDILQQVQQLAADASTPTSGRMQVHVDGRLPVGAWHEGPPREAPSAIRRLFGDDSESYARTGRHTLTLRCPECDYQCGGDWLPPPPWPSPMDPRPDLRAEERKEKSAACEHMLDRVRSTYDRHLCGAQATSKT